MTATKQTVGIGFAPVKNVPPINRRPIIEFRVYRDHKGEWRWSVMHLNGNIVADSGEGYGSRAKAKNAAKRFIEHVVTIKAAGRAEPVALD